jgi:hypothetical protein
MPSGRLSKAITLTTLALWAWTACAAPTSTEGPGSPSYARGSTSGAPTVTSTNPSSATRGTTIDVHVLGSGFDASSKAQWAIGGVPSSKVVVNSTHYVNSGEVVANITIATDADLTLYDVIVSAVGGKPGIGSEMFLVALEEAELPTAGGPYNAAVAINDQGVIVGMTSDRGSGRPGSQEIPRYPVRWNLVNGTWAMTKLASVSSVRAIANSINESNVIVGMSNLRATVWLPNGTMVDLGPGCATSINALNYIVGAEVTSTGYNGVVWIPTQGTWVRQYVPGALDINTAAMYSCEFSPLRAINGAGTIVGFPGEIAMKWIALGPTGPWTDPVVLTPGPYGKGISSEAWAINEAGDIAGELSLPEGMGPHLWRANGQEIHYLQYGSGAGFAFGINDSPLPDVVAGANNARHPVALFGGAETASLLTRFGGNGNYNGALDVNNPTATQPLRIVGAVSGKAKVWTAR